jgi:UDP-N-acetyl-D-mannosaminuronic acid dehydrogenase
VIGVDIKPERVAKINQGISPIEGDEPGLAELLRQVVADGLLQATTDYAHLATADVLSINVETPVNADNRPEYAALKASCRSLGPVLKPGALVIVESTVAPGTVDRVVGPVLAEASGQQVNQGFYLGACPERVMPGKLLANLRGLSRVCGGSTPETAQVMVALYQHIVQADLDATDVMTAELVKTTENAYRDVQIAFANEVALICEANGADVWQVRELVNKSPYRQMHLPGAGVGGHCIPKDPWLLAHSVHERDVPLRLIPASRAVNDGMPLHMVELTRQALAAAGRELTEARVAVLGYAYLENSDDTRSSPSAVLVSRLRELGVEVVIHDPWVAEYQGDLRTVVRGCDAAVVMVGHTDYRSLDLPMLKQELRTPILIDGRGLYAPAQVQAAGLVYRGVGRAG